MMSGDRLGPWSTWYSIYPQLAAMPHWDRPWLSSKAIRSEYGVRWPLAYMPTCQVVVYAETEAGPPGAVADPRAALFHMAGMTLLDRPAWDNARGSRGVAIEMIDGTPVAVHDSRTVIGKKKIFLFGAKVRCTLTRRSFRQNRNLSDLREWGEGATMTVQARIDPEVTEKLLGILMPHMIEHGIDWEILNNSWTESV